MLLTTLTAVQGPAPVVEGSQVLITLLSRPIFVVEGQESFGCLRCYGNKRCAIGAAEENSFLIVWRFIGDVSH